MSDLNCRDLSCISGFENSDRNEIHVREIDSEIPWTRHTLPDSTSRAFSAEFKIN